MIVAVILAVASILGQGAVVWMFLRFVKTFGRYTESQQEFTKALLFTHESNLIVHQHNVKVLEELRALRTHQEKVA